MTTINCSRYGSAILHFEGLPLPGMTFNFGAVELTVEEVSYRGVFITGQSGRGLWDQ